MHRKDRFHENHIKFSNFIQAKGENISPINILSASTTQQLTSGENILFTYTKL